ncbi:MAG: HypC/HybG/HupF family hydrogenase formation chaperone [Candidatus Zixiibacteriota bacterium]
MCLAVPGKVVEIAQENGLCMGRIDYDGMKGKACLELVPGVQVGQYVIVHAGFAINIIDEKEALKVLSLWDEFRSEQQLQPGSPVEDNPTVYEEGVEKS